MENQRKSLLNRIRTFIDRTHIDAFNSMAGMLLFVFVVIFGLIEYFLLGKGTQGWFPISSILLISFFFILIGIFGIIKKEAATRKRRFKGNSAVGIGIIRLLMGLYIFWFGFSLLNL